MASCADCGVHIYYLPAWGRWAQRIVGDPGVFSFTCRMYYDTDDSIWGADYHHVRGSAQQRLRLPAKEQ